MSTARKRALVIGANGVIGRTLTEHLASLDDWDVIGVSRRGGQDTTRISYLSVDLLDAPATQAALGEVSGVTHVFYAAYQDRPTWAGLVAPNLAMLVNAVEAIDQGDSTLQHVSLMQGYKVYGAHLGPFQTPAREDAPRHMPPEFNIDQQDYLERRRAGRGWTWSALRPSVVCGTALGNPMNLVVVIAVYAAMCRELGLPLRFPGRPGAYDTLLEMTDAGLLARATVWAATDPACANQALNITNGDLFRWNDMWPHIAADFGLEVAPPLHMSLVDVMADKEDLWNSMVVKHGLQPTPYADVSSWPFGDAVFSWNYDFLSDGTKARRLGFAEHVESRSMFSDLFQELRDSRIIPPRPAP